MLGMRLLMIGALGLALAGWAHAVELRLKWEVGKRYTFEVSSSTAMTMTVGDKAMASESDMAQEICYKAALHEKGTEVTMEVESIKMGMRVNGQAMMDYDSKKNPEGGVLGASFKPILDLKARAIYDKDGEIVEISGLDGLVGLDQVGSGAEQIEMMMREASQLMPGKDVAVGESWKSMVEFPMAPLAKEPATMVFDLKLEAMEEKDGKELARISLTGRIENQQENGAEAPLQLRSKSISGEILFDAELGQPRESGMKMELEMGVPEDVPLAEGAPGKIPMTIVTSQKLLSVENVEKE